MRKITHYLFLIFATLTCGATLAQEPLRVTIFGDSYSTFEGEVNPIDNALWYFAEPRFERTDVERVEQTWWWQFIDSGNYTLAMNNSYSGSTICNTGYEGKDFSKFSFITRMNNLNNPDIILIYGATNDSWAGAPIGEFKYEEWSSEELYSFRPAMAYMLSYIRQNYPHAEPYFMINDTLKEEVVESIKTICTHYKTPYIELKEIDKIDGHPSIKGMHQIYKQLTAALVE